MTPPGETCVSEVMMQAKQRLESVSDSPLLDCQIILGHVMDRPRNWLYAHGDDDLTERQAACFQALVDRRTAGEPVAYITGTRAFWKRDFRVSPGVLIPRPETELLIETVLELLNASPQAVVDLGTGSGIIAVSLAAERPDWQVTGIDRSTAALEVATSNGADLGNLTFQQGNWCEGLGVESIDVIVSNPPYVREDDPHLTALAFEPATALVSGPDGLRDLTEIVSQSYDCLVAGGLLAVEHGYDQQVEVIALFETNGFEKISGRQDLEGTPRIVTGFKP